MPPVLLAAAALVGSTSLWVGAAVIVTIAATVASVAFSAYMMASMEVPKQPDATKRLQTVRSSIQPHRMIYGECMTGGVLVYAQSHGLQNKYISLVVAFTGHEVEEIKEVWLNEKRSDDLSFWQRYVPPIYEEGYWDYTNATQDESGGVPPTWVVTTQAVPGRWESVASIRKYLGTPDQLADPDLCALPPNPTTVISGNPDSGLNDLTVYNPITGTYYGAYTDVGMCVITISIASVGAGSIADAFFWTQTKYRGDGTIQTDAASGTMTMTGAVQTIVDGISVAFGTFAENGWFTFSTQGHSMGQSWEIRSFDGAPWTPDCRLRGRSYVAVTLENNDTAFPNGLPNIKALIRGNNQIYDPRTGTIGYSDNWALCVRDYLTKKYGIDAPSTDVNDSVAIAAANICDELVLQSNGSSQKRYTINGSFTLDKTPTAIMQEILATAFGSISWCQGQYRIYPAAYYEPDATFHGMNPNVPGLTESDLRGDIRVRPSVSMKDRFNTVRGTHISPSTWQPVDFPAVTNAMYVAQDGGEIAKDLQLTYITNSLQAQRVAKIVLEKNRQGIVVDFPAKWSAFPLTVGDNVPVSIALLGWDQKIFTVSDWKMNPEGGVDLSLREDAAGCYDWNSGEETTVDLAPNTILPDPQFVSPPTGLAVGEELYATNVGSIIKSRAFLSWSDSGAARYEAASMPPNNTIWAPIATAGNTTVTIDDTSPGMYQFRVRAMNRIGAWSAWATISYQMQGKSAAPPPVDSFLVSAQPDGTREFSWAMAIPPLDLAGYRMRYCSGTSGTWGTMTALHSGLLLAAPFESNQLAAGDYTFAIVAEDTTGNQSDARYITVTLSDPRMAGVILSESCGGLGWPGTKTGCVVDGSGALVAVGTDLWSTFSTGGVTWADWTAWTMHPTSPIQYDHTTIDLGVSSQVTPIVSASGDGTLIITVSTSNDNATWSGYAALTPVKARYFRFRVSTVGTFPTLTSVIVYLSAQPVTEDVNDLVTSTLTGAHRIGVGDIRLPLAKSYSIIQSVQVALQGTGAGWTWKLIDKTVTNGPRIQIYNGSGALADATIDATIKGL